MLTISDHEYYQKSHIHVADSQKPEVDVTDGGLNVRNQIASVSNDNVVTKSSMRGMCFEKEDVIKNLMHVKFDDGRIYSSDNALSNSFFNAQYKPHKWTIIAVSRDKNAPYYSNDIVKFQYNTVSKEQGFSGVMPVIIKHKHVVNQTTLTETKGKIGDDLLSAYLNKTPNGKFTNRIVMDFGLEVSHVTLKEKITPGSNSSTNIYTHIKAY